MRRRVPLLFVIICLFSFSLHTTNSSANCISSIENASVEYLWSITYGGVGDDHIRALQVASNGDYIILGITESFDATYNDWWIMRLNPNGDVIWEHSIDWSGSDRTWGILETSYGGIIASGGYASDFGEDAIILELTGDGDLVWKKSFTGGARFLYSIAETQDDGLIMVGQINAGGEETWVIKTDSSGEVVWEKFFTGVEMGSGIVTSDDDILIFGRTTASGAGAFDYWVGKLSSDGDFIWQKTYGGVNSEYDAQVIETYDGGYIIAGSTANSFGAGEYDGWLLKIDTDGNPLWQKTYGGESIDYIFSTDETASRDILVAGYSNSFGYGDQDFLLLKLDSAGNIIWQKNYGGLSNDVAHIIKETPDGGIIVGGESNSFGAGNFDFWIMKLDNEGNIGNCDLQFDGFGEVHNTAAIVSTTEYSFTDIVSNTSVRNYSIQDTEAVSYWICPFYYHFLPFISKY